MRSILIQWDSYVWFKHGILLRRFYGNLWFELMLDLRALYSRVFLGYFLGVWALCCRILPLQGWRSCWLNGDGISWTLAVRQSTKVRFHLTTIFHVIWLWTPARHRKLRYPFWNPYWIFIAVSHWKRYKYFVLTILK